jgi:raffinose/stachyose/melibiose transport system substrate-binding protein
MKKMRFLIVLVFIFSLVMTSCQTPVEKTAAPEGGQDAGGKEKIVLEYWSMWNEPEPQAKAIAAWISAFEAKNPNITINATWNGRENQTKIRSALAGGTKIDFMDQDADQIVAGLIAQNMGYSLNEFLKQDALDMDGTVADTFASGTLDLHKSGDDYYLFPYIYNTWQFWTNRDILEKAGVTEDPQTWDEFLTMAQQIQDAGYVALTAEGLEFSYNAPYFVYIVERLKGPGFLLDAARDKTGEKWNDPAFLQAAGMIRELWDKNYFPEEAIGYIWPAAQQTLAFGDAAMELCGSWLPTELRDTAGEDFNWGGLRFPAIKGGKGDISDITAWLLAFMIMKDSKNPEAVFDFLKFTMTQENAQLMANEALVGVTRKDVAWPDTLKDGEQAAANANVTLLPVDGIQAFYPEYQETVFTPAYNAFFALELSPEEFIAKMVKDTQSYWANH